MPHNDDTPRFSRADLASFLDKRTLLRGEEYQRVGRVSHLLVSKGGAEISAQVRGQEKTPYKTKISLIKSKIQGFCSCYVGHNCKHVAATLLERLNELSIEKSEAAEPLAPMNSEMLQSRFLSSPTSLAASQTTSTGSHWISFLEKMQKSPSPVERESASKKQAILYVLDIVSIYHDQVFLKIDLVIANILKKGGHGTYKPFSFGNANHATAMTPEDVLNVHNLQIAKKKLNLSSYMAASGFILGGPMAKEVLAAIVSTNRCYWKKAGGASLSFGEAKTGSFSWEFSGNGLQSLVCKAEKKDNIIILPTLPCWYIDNTTIGPLSTEFDDNTTVELIKGPPVGHLEAALLREAALNGTHPLKNLPLPKAMMSEVKNGTPVPYLKLIADTQDPDNYNRSAYAVLSFQYDGALVEFNNPAQTIEYSDGDIIYSLQRDFKQELVFFNIIRKMQVIEVARSKGKFGISLPFMFENLPMLREQGWVIDIAEDFPLNCTKEEDWYTEVEDKTQYDWFGFELGILVDGQKINILPLLVNLIAQNPGVLNAQKIKDLADDHPFHLQLPDKRYVLVEAKRIKEILFVLVELYDTKALTDGKLKVDYVQAAQLLGLQQALKARWMGGQKLKALGEKLLNFNGIEPCALPKQFKGKLRAYQKEGVDWLNFLREYQLGGILADDMGLGKTVQVLTHLLAEKESGRQKHPNLIVAPTSLMNNWDQECKRFTPDLKLLILQGTNRQVDFEKIHTADIILSTYPLMNRDKAMLLGHQFHYLVLDEAQYIKNPNTKAYQSLLDIKANHTLCMTGTPMENHLGELWALFNFTVPGLLGESKKFKQLFRDPIEKEGDVSRQKSLAQRVKPFMLRRTKGQVATELPEKTEIIHSIELSPSQLDLYEGIRLAMQAKVVTAVKQQGFMRSQIVILDALLKLRQTCNDPRLLPLMKGKETAQSAKREFLMEMLDTLIEEGRKILLFSSFASMLALIEQELIEKKIKYVILTGQTKDRATPVNEFQEGDVPIMLISLKAGGVGLNLTAADTVIHYDPWWNPAAEAQATDRAHRIGQTKPVFVYKLVCKGTVEEKILKMQENKKQLLSGIFKEGENQSPKLSAKDLAYLFEPIV